jgi:hypothetical protein
MIAKNRATARLKSPPSDNHHRAFALRPGPLASLLRAASVMVAGLLHLVVREYLSGFLEKPSAGGVMRDIGTAKGDETVGEFHRFERFDELGLSFHISRKALMNSAATWGTIALP